MSPDDTFTDKQADIPETNLDTGKEGKMVEESEVSNVCSHNSWSCVYRQLIIAG